MQWGGADTINRGTGGAGRTQVNARRDSLGLHGFCPQGPAKLCRCLSLLHVLRSSVLSLVLMDVLCSYQNPSSSSLIYRVSRTIPCVIVSWWGRSNQSVIIRPSAAGRQSGMTAKNHGRAGKVK